MKTATSPTVLFSGKTSIATLLCAALLSISAAQGATIISVNFQGSNPVALAPTDSTGATAAINWNNVTGASGGGIALNDSTGAASGITLTSYAAGPFGAEGGNTGNSTPQEILFGGGLNVNFGNASFTLSGLSAFSSYDIIAYYSGGTSFPDARHADFTASGTSTIFYVAGINSVYTSYTQSTSTTPGTFTSGNFVTYSGLADPTQTITMEYGNNSMALIGFQVVGTAVPEPSTCVLAGMSCFAFVFLRRLRLRTRA
jgi:hypothetical protein